jgi:nonsense-mediated mRNA decay protein 3
MKASEITSGGQQYHVKTHLGHLLNIGDSALGFDIANANVNDENVDAIKPENLPDVVSVINGCKGMLLNKKLY